MAGTAARRSAGRKPVHFADSSECTLATRARRRPDTARLCSAADFGSIAVRVAFIDDSSAAELVRTDERRCAAVPLFCAVECRITRRIACVSGFDRAESYRDATSVDVV